MRQKVCLCLAAIFLSVSLNDWAQQRVSEAPKWNVSSHLPLNPALYGVRHWRVGESAEYTLVTHRGERHEVKKLRYAILGEQHFAGSSYYVVETQVTELDDARRTTINSAVRPFGDLANLLEGATGEFVTKQDTAPARSIPIQVLKERIFPFQTQAQLPKISSSEILDVEVIETPAGKFKTTHQKFHFEDGRAAEVWSAGGVGPIGLVKVVSKDFLLTLISHQGKRSVSAITEIPKPALDQ
jgi:hypothetical protein